MRAAFWKIIVAAAMFILALPGHARITRVVIARTDVIGSGGYQKLTGHAYGETRPQASAERHHHRSRICAAKRARDGGVCGDVHHHQAGRHDQSQRCAALLRPEPRPHQSDGRRIPRRCPQAGPRAGGERLAGRHRAGGRVSRRWRRPLPKIRMAPASPDRCLRASATCPPMRRPCRSCAAAWPARPIRPASILPRPSLTRRASENGKIVPAAQHRLGIRRLQPDSVPRQARSAQALPEGRLQSSLSLRARVYRQGSESLWHRLRRHARFELVSALWRAGRYRRSQSFARSDLGDRELRQFAVRKLPPQLHSSRASIRMKWDA